MLLQRIHPDKPYLEMMQGTREKVEIYKDDYGIEILDTEEDANSEKHLKNQE